MKKVLVTGATGFIGNHLVQLLCDRGYEVTAVARDKERAKTMAWYKRVRFISYDIHQAENPVTRLGIPDILIHLAWPGLPQYQSLFHFEKNLPADYHFLSSFIQAGIDHVLVTGTCFEYGLQVGSLSEDMPTQPHNPYGLAKDVLRKFLQELQKKSPFVLQWARLFYMYGEGQYPNSLMAQLNGAIKNREAFFNMSEGEQLRDYLPVKEVAKQLLQLVEHPNCQGVVNCCSGAPISVRRLVEQYIEENNADIKLNLGYLPYSGNESMAFWGNNNKFRKFTNT